jgi:transcriptional regulator with XRE-family HTH domain
MARDALTDPRGCIGDELRRARQLTGLSQEAFASAIGFDHSVVGKTETGDRRPTTQVLRAWCERCALDYEHYARLVQAAWSADGPVPSWFLDYLDHERVAVVLHMWSPVLIPGALQVADYARELFRAAGSSDDRASELVDVRMARRALLDRSDPPNVVALADESVLHRLIGTPAIMHEALSELAELSARPHVIVQIVPMAKGANAGLCGTFDIAIAPDGTSTLCIGTVEDQTTDSRSLVIKAANIFDLVRANALPRDESRTLILEASEGWKAKS